MYTLQYIYNIQQIDNYSTTVFIYKSVRPQNRVKTKHQTKIYIILIHINMFSKYICDSEETDLES